MGKPTKASRALALLAAACWQAASAQVAPTTLPTGGTVAAGTASISTSGSNMQITQGSSQAILNWQSFSIGSGAWVNFTQPSVSSVALNRVLGTNPSEIYGRLTANGQVFLTNPAGVLFAPGASVDVGNLFATTLSIRDQDFLAGRYTFSNAGNAGSVVNQGVITVNGYAALAAPSVRNDGLIVARAGTVALGAGDRVLVDMVGDRLISLSVDQAALNAAAINTGTITACGGRVLLTARSANALLDTVVNNSGTIRADSLVLKNGEIILCGGGKGVVANSGTLQASGAAAGTRGGTIKVLGENVGLFDGSRIDASGEAGGGTVLVGGNFQGAGPEANASHVYIAPDAKINADAISNGKGGNVSVWADDGTKFFGSISVRGGAQGGDGGFVETSAGNALMAMGCVDLRALNGKGGTWSLDPNNIKIVAGCGTCSISQAGGNFCSNNDSAQLGVNKIRAALAACGATVNISTKNGGANSQAGNICWCGQMLCAGSTTGSTLQLAAANNITLRNFIAAATGKKLSVRLGGLCCGAAPGTISMLCGSAIGTNGGNIIANATGGIVMTNAVLCADAGIVKLTSAGAVTQSGTSAIFAGGMALCGSANFTLASACNHVGTLAASANGHTVRYSDQGSFSVGSAGGLCGINVGSTGTVILTAGVPLGCTPTVSQTKPITAGGLVLNGKATYNLTGSSNSINNLAGTGACGAINFKNQGGLNVACVAGTSGIHTANATLTSVSGGITVNADLAATGTLSLTTTDHAINQAGGSISANTFTASAGTGDITLTGSNTFRCIPSITGGTINVNVSGACSATSVTVTTATASGALTLRSDVGSLAAQSLSGTDVAITNTGVGKTLAVSNVTATGTLSLCAIGPITQSSGTISATGATTVNAHGGDITLAQGNNNFSSISLTGGAISVKDTNSLTVSSLSSGTNKAVTLIAGGTLTLPASAIDTGTAALDLESNGGTLTTAGNLAGGDITLVGSGGISLGHNVTAGGTLNLASTDSAITQTAGQISATGLTTVSAGTGFINLAQGSNEFSTISLTGGAISVNTDSSLTLDNVTAGGNISIAANGASSDIVVASGKTIGTTNADISLSAGRDVQLAGTAAVQTTGAGNIELVSGSAGTGIGTITVATNGAVSVENGAAKFYYNPGAGYGTLSDFSSKVTINACSGTTSSLAWVYAKGDSRTYDRTTGATLSFDTAVNGDPHVSNAVSLDPGTASFDTKDAGTGKTITFSGYGLTGAASGSFALFGGASGTRTANVAKLDTNIAGSRTYDATGNANAADFSSVTALIGGDSVTISGAGTLADKNVGTGKAVSNGTLALAGSDSGNYNLLATGNSLTVTKLDLNVSGIAASNKVYNASQVATLTGTPSVSPLGSDDVTVGGAASGTFADKNVGTGKAVTVTGHTLGGGDAGNYNLLEPATLTADITPRNLAVKGLSASGKVYDATTDATLAGTASISPLGSDDVTLGGTAVGTFSTKDVGSRHVTVTGNTLGGADAGNYTLVEPVTLRADITQASLDISGVTAKNKVYDSTTGALLSGTATVTALGTDSVVVRGPYTASFASEDVGTGIGVTVAGYTLSGRDAANYSPVQPAGLTANITPKNLLVTGLSATGKVYDATTAAPLTGTAAINAILGDDVTLGGTAVGTFSTKNVGDRHVTVTGNTLGGADAANYTLLEPGTLKASITQATLDVTGVAARNKVYDATTDARLSGAATVTALGSDSVVLRGPYTAVFASKDVGSGISVTVTGYTLAGADHANYMLVQPTGLAADITPARLTYTGTPTSISQGSPITGLTGTVTGFLGGDTLQNSTTGTLQWKTNARRSSPPGSYLINGSGLTAPNYFFGQAPANATALTITP